jgi:hypothetical protein
LTSRRRATYERSTVLQGDGFSMRTASLDIIQAEDRADRPTDHEARPERRAIRERSWRTVNPRTCHSHQMMKRAKCAPCGVHQTLRSCRALIAVTPSVQCDC